MRAASQPPKLTLKEAPKAPVFITKEDSSRRTGTRVVQHAVRPSPPFEEPLALNDWQN